jgi:2-amino-4-hydroxy-6-hydroxymethyldihydropteridine diphosphokinase
MTQPVQACIGLGANLGDRQANINAALAALRDTEGVSLTATAPLLRTAPVTRTPGEQQPDYLNSAAVVETTLTARQLLDTLLSIERSLGRDRAHEERWGPRLIDLDLLLYGDAVIEEPGLTVPHPEMHKRAFVLAPLSQIAPDATHPVLSKSMQLLLTELQKPARVISHGVALLLAGLLGTSAFAQAPSAPPEAPQSAAGIVAHLAETTRNADFDVSIETRIVGSTPSAPITGYLYHHGALTLGALGIQWGDGAYRIWSLDAPDRVIAGDALPGVELQTALRSLPTLPIPQIRFLAGENSLDALWGEIQWSDSTRIVPGEQAIELTGVSPSFLVSISDADAKPPIDLVRIASPTDADGPAIEIRSSVATDPPALPSDLDDRRAVESFKNLLPMAGELATGQQLSGLVLLDSQSVPWFGKPAADTPILLLFLREADPWSDEVRNVIHQMAETPWLGDTEIHAVMVMENNDPDLAVRVADRIHEWGGGVLWTVSAESSINLFAPDATAVAVLIDDEGVIADICVIENRASDPKSLARRFLNALSD